MKFKDLFAYNFDNEFETVITFQDISEKTLYSEINNYIITPLVQKNMELFFEKINSKTSASGIWISGYFGSGKSHFAKIIYYLLENRTMNNNKITDFFIEKLSFIDESSELKQLIETSSNQKFMPVLFDLSEAAGSNYDIKTILLDQFLKKAGYSSIKDYGWIEFNLDKLNRLEEYKALFSSKEKLTGVEKILKKMGFTDSEIKRLSDHKLNSSSELVDIISDYISSPVLNHQNYETVVFIEDETEQFLNTNERILELQGIIHSFEKLKKIKLWYVGLAQNRIDKNNSNEIFKLKDRFKLTIHFSSEEISLIVKERLLKKKDIELFKKYYMENATKILINSNKFSFCDSYDESKPNTSAELFAGVYPLHSYSINLLSDLILKKNNKKNIHGGGERNTLNIIYSVLKNIFSKQSNEKKIGFCIPLYYFFELIESANDEFHKIIKKAADDFYSLEANILKTMLLIESWDEKYSESGISSDELSKFMIEDLNTDLNSFKKIIEEKLLFLKDSHIILSKNGKWRVITDSQQQILKLVSKIRKNEEFPRFIKKSENELFHDFFKNHTSFEIDDGIKRNFAIEINGNRISKTKEIISYDIYFSQENLNEFIKIARNTNEKAYIFLPDNNLNLIIEEYAAYKMVYEYTNISNLNKEEKNILDIHTYEISEKIKSTFEKLLEDSVIIYYKAGKVKTEGRIIEFMKKFAGDEIYKNLFPEYKNFEYITKKDIAVISKATLKQLSNLYFQFFKDDEINTEYAAINHLLNCSGIKISDIIKKYSSEPYGWNENSITFFILLLHKFEMIKFISSKGEIIEVEDYSKLNDFNNYLYEKTTVRDLEQFEVNDIVRKLKIMKFIEKDNVIVKDTEGIFYVMKQNFCSIKNSSALSDSIHLKKLIQMLCDDLNYEFKINASRYFLDNFSQLRNEFDILKTNIKVIDKQSAIIFYQKLQYETSESLSQLKEKADKFSNDENELLNIWSEYKNIFINKWNQLLSYGTIKEDAVLRDFEVDYKNYTLSRIEVEIENHQLKELIKTLKKVDNV